MLAAIELDDRIVRDNGGRNLSGMGLEVEVTFNDTRSNFSRGSLIRVKHRLETISAGGRFEAKSGTRPSVQAWKLGFCPEKRACDVRLMTTKEASVQDVPLRSVEMSVSDEK